MFHQIRFPSCGQGADTSFEDEAIIRPDGRVLPLDPPSGFLAVDHMTLFKGRDEAGATIQPDVNLAPRELEVLLWAARGKSAWETAQLLGLSERTVKFYIQRACAKLNAQNKTHAVATVLTRGLLQL